MALTLFYGAKTFLNPSSMQFSWQVREFHLWFKIVWMGIYFRSASVETIMYTQSKRESWDILQQAFQLINVSPHHDVCWQPQIVETLSKHTGTAKLFLLSWNVLFPMIITVLSSCLLCIFPCARRSIHILPTVMHEKRPS